MELDFQKLRIDRRARIRSPLVGKLRLQMAARSAARPVSDAAWQMNTVEEMDLRFHRDIDPRDLLIADSSVSAAMAPQRAWPMLMLRRLRAGRALGKG